MIGLTHWLNEHDSIITEPWLKLPKEDRKSTKLQDATFKAQLLPFNNGEVALVFTIDICVIIALIDDKSRRAPVMCMLPLDVISWGEIKEALTKVRVVESAEQRQSITLNSIVPAKV